MTEGRKLGIEVGFQVERELSFTREDLMKFAELTGDYAPIHHDSSHAQVLGYSDIIVFGHLAVAPFSEMIGEFPGSDWVIVRHQFEFRKPIYLNRKLSYVCNVEKVRPALGIVELKLEINGESGVLVSGALSVQKNFAMLRSGAEPVG